MSCITETITKIKNTPSENDNASIIADKERLYEKTYILEIICNKKFLIQKNKARGTICFVCNKNNAIYGFDETMNTHCGKCYDSKTMVPFRHRDKSKIGKKYEFKLNDKLLNNKEYIISILNHRFFEFKMGKNGRSICLICKKKDAYYGFKDTKGTHCGQCKLDEMISYKILPKNKENNFKIQKDKLYDINYINELLKNEEFTFKYNKNSQKLCLICDKNNAYYGYEDTVATFCTYCKKNDMVSYKSICSCTQGKEENKRKIYGLKDSKTGKIKATNCIYCKTDGMESSQPTENKNCQKCNNVKACFGIKGKGMTSCFSCKTPEMEDLSHLSTRCNNCRDWPDYHRGIKELDGYCTLCFQQLYPLDNRTFLIKIKTKEIAVRDFINSKYDGFHHDKVLEYGGDCECAHRRRIDHRALIGNTLLCIETDENQHKNYDHDDEMKRYHDLFSYFSCKFVFIRFNPDKYKTKAGKFVDPTLISRFVLLEQTIDQQIARIENEENTELLEVHYLFFDEN